MTGNRETDATAMKEIRENSSVAGVLEGVHMLILHTIGAKSGQPRENPLVFQPGEDGCEFYIFASNAGQGRSPAWYFNALAHSEKVAVEIGRSKYPMRVRNVMGDERGRIYAQQADRIENFADYQRKTSRVIPVLGLTRSD